MLKGRNISVRACKRSQNIFKMRTRKAVKSYHLFLLFVVLAFSGIFTGCIKNDIPYPRIQPNIVSLEVENQSQATQLDTINRVATVYLNEEADIYGVNVIECTLSDKASFVGDSIAGTIDLSSPRHYILEIYQEYVWTLKAVQTIERYFTVANQIGATVIDVPGRRVVVTLPTTADLSKVKVLTAKLGSTASVITPDIVGEYIDLTQPFKITVTDYGREADWTIYCQVTEATVTTVRADAWTNVAWVYGEGQEGRDNYIEYREASSDQWQRVPDSWLTVNGGSFYARLIHLQSLTDYVARAVSGDEYGAEVEFRTGVNVQPPNADFDNWWLNGKVWNPWAEGGTPYWDTGNKGATTLGQSNTQPSDDTPTGTGKSAKLETKFVGIGMIGKLAAGNIFAGYYVKTDGTNGILSFGREFTERPTKLRGYYKYQTAPISSTTTGFTDLKGQPDTCIVWVALIDADEPFEIRTNPNNRHLFDPEASDVIAYGNFQSGTTQPDWTQFEFELDYKATNRVPKYILIVGSASKYGDYFTGGNGAVLYLDDIELLYDY